MEYNNYYDKGQTLAQSSVFAVLMRNVYTWMACGLAMTALTAMIVGRNENWVYTLATSGMYWGLLIAEVVLVIFLSARINKMSFATAGLMFAAYAILNGVTMSIIMLLYTAESIAQAFFVTAGTFGAMSLVGFFIKKDLSAMGRTLMMAKYRAMATKAFSPPDSSEMARMDFPGSSTLISMPQFSRSLSSSSLR